jgi:hypothetical protein
MSKIMTAVAPKKMKPFGMPLWFHGHGMRIAWYGFDDATAPTSTMILNSNSVKIKIRSNAGHGYIVEYTITQSPDCHNSGTIWMSKKNIEAAFGLSNTCPEFGGQWLADEYGADVAQQGQYIRYGNFLNIPGPGTGNDGDSNVSIFIDKKIQDAIKILFK